MIKRAALARALIMTGELRKKKELRKYLSDSTYRQIMIWSTRVSRVSGLT